MVYREPNKVYLVKNGGKIANSNWGRFKEYFCRSGASEASEGTTLYNETLQPTFFEIFTTFLGAQWKEICIFYERFTTFLGAAL